MKAGTSTTARSNGQTGVVVRDARVNFTQFHVSPGVPLDTTASGQTYALRNRASRMNLDNACDGGCGGQSTSGVAVIQYPASAPYPLDTSLTQLWTFSAMGNGSFAIVSVMSGMCLDNPYGNAAPSRTLPQTNGTSTMLWQQPCNGLAPQSWRFIPTGDGSFAIQNQASQLFIDAFDANQATQMWTNTNSGDDSQHWQLVVQ
jgi:hypothetical protein